MTESDYLENTQNYAGYCRKCDDVTTFEGIEPDAEKYRCDDCDRPSVCGVEQALLLGYITLAPLDEVIGARIASSETKRGTAPLTYQRSLQVNDMNRFCTAIDFSRASIKPKAGYNRTLTDCIMYLMTGHYAQADTLQLTNDSVLHSFGFALLRKGQPVITGAIILHGYEETYAVELNSEPTPHYSIHT